MHVDLIQSLLYFLIHNCFATLNSSDDCASFNFNMSDLRVCHTSRSLTSDCLEATFFIVWNQKSVPKISLNPFVMASDASVISIFGLYFPLVPFLSLSKTNAKSSDVSPVYCNCSWVKCSIFVGYSDNQNWISLPAQLISGITVN